MKKNHEISNRRDLNSEEKIKEKKKLIEQFPHRILFQNREQEIHQIKKCLEQLGRSPPQLVKDIQELTEQLELTYHIWYEIMINGKISPLTKAGVHWDPFL